MTKRRQRHTTTLVRAPRHPSLRIELFGAPRVFVEGSQLPRLRSRKGLELLALLCIHHDRELDRSWIAGKLWPDVPEERAGDSLRTSLYDLRRALGSEASRVRCVGTRRLCFDTGGASVDVVEFDDGVRTGDVLGLERAVGVHRGMLFEACTTDWIAGERDARARTMASALEKLAALELERGAFEDAVIHLERLVAIEPLLETAHRSLMRAYELSGRYTDAIQTYHRLKESLEADSKTSPSPETTALYRELRVRSRRAAACVERLFNGAVVGEGDAERGVGPTLVLVGTARFGGHDVPIRLAVQVPRDG